MTDEQASLTPAQLATAFPFHLTLDHETRIRAVGLSIGRVLGEHAVGRPFAELFRFTRPHITGTSAEMKQQAGRLVVIESLAEPRIHLRGSILPAEGDVGFFLLLSPWITRLDDIERLGLTLSDFATHDPVADLLPPLGPHRVRFVANRIASRTIAVAGPLDPVAFWPWTDTIGGSRWPGTRGGPIRAAR